MRGANEKQYYNGSGLSSIRPASQNTYKECLASLKVLKAVLFIRVFLITKRNREWIALSVQ